MWTEIICGGRNMYIATVYMVPIGSPYYEQNEKIRQELEIDTREFKEQGVVIILGEFNSRIKNLMSITSKKQSISKRECRYKRTK